MQRFARGQFRVGESGGTGRRADVGFRTVSDILAAARECLAPELWDHAEGGAGTEATIRRNRDSLDEIRFRPRVLRDVAERSTATTILGMPATAPVALAPVGPVELYDPDGALASARAAAAWGTLSVVSMTSSPALDVVARESRANLAFQVYVRGDQSWLGELVDRVEDAGYQALCLTVDAPSYGRRERDLRNGFVHYDHQRQPNLGAAAEHLGRGAQLSHQLSVTWDDVTWLRDRTSLPLVLKGIMTAEDAAQAVETGVDAVYVSNHGGRMLDHQLGTAEVLSEVVEAVGRRAQVLVDGGFQHGEDVLKALCLGADAVLLGRLQLYALAAGGQSALESLLTLIHDELLTAMAVLGANNLQALTPDLVATP